MSNIKEVYYEFGGAPHVMAAKATFYNLTPGPTAEDLDLQFTLTGNPHNHYRLHMLMNSKGRHDDSITFTLQHIATNIAGTLIHGFMTATDYRFELSLPEVFGKEDWIHFQEMWRKEFPSWEEIEEMNALEKILPEKLDAACAQKGLSEIGGNGFTHMEMIEMFVDYKKGEETMRLARPWPELVASNNFE